MAAPLRLGLHAALAFATVACVLAAGASGLRGKVHGLPLAEPRADVVAAPDTPAPPVPGD